MVEDLLPGLFDGIVIDFHLFREIFLQPFVLLDVVVDELDGQISFYLNSSFAFLAVVEPSLSPPSDSRLVGIDANQAWNVEALHIDVQFCQWVNYSACRYCPVLCFFFSMALMLDRKI